MIDNKEMAEFCYNQLITIPQELSAAELLVEQASQSLNELRDVLDMAVLDAEFNAPQDGKNAEERKRQIKVAVQNSGAVKAATLEIRKRESEIIEMEASKNELKYKFRSALALAELQSARLNMMSKIQNN